MLQYLAEQDFSGHIVLEVNLRRSATRAQREADLAESLAFARLHLAAPVYASYAVDGWRGGQRAVAGLPVRVGACSVAPCSACPAASRSRTS